MDSNAFVQFPLMIPVPVNTVEYLRFFGEIDMFQ